MKHLIFFLALALSSVARCQTQSQSLPLSSSLPSPTPVTTLLKQALPSLLLVGGEYGTSTSPHFSGFMALGLPVLTSAGLYSYSMYQGLIVNGKLTTSTTTGMADDLKTFCNKTGCAVLIGIGTAGVATSSTASLALSGGGGGLFRFNDGWAVGIFGLENTAGGVNKPSLLLGFGRTW
jgi:hypothetical protein